MEDRAEQFVIRVRESLRDDPLVAAVCPITECVPDTGEYLAATFPLPPEASADLHGRLRQDYRIRRSALLAKVMVLDELVRRLEEASIPFKALFVGFPELSEEEGESSVTFRFGFF